LKIHGYVKDGKDCIIARRIFTADNFIQRSLGLILRKPLEYGEAFLIKDCRSIHTIGMRYNIDVLFIDKNSRVIASFKDVSPWRITPFVSDASSAIEFRSGFAETQLPHEGEKILFV
jgi:uncharacterized protein